MNMKERIARRLCKLNRGDPDELSAIGGVPVWKAYLRDAEECLLEMKEPTPAMFAAGGAPVDENTKMIAQVYEDWQSMVQTALDEK